MAISVSVFSALTSTFQLTEPEISDGWSQHRLGSDLIYEDAQSSAQLPGLWYQARNDVSLAAFIRKLEVWLAKRDLPASDKCVQASLGIIGLLSEMGLDLDQILAKLEELASTVNQGCVFVIRGAHEALDVGRLECGGFEFQRLEASKLLYLCEKAGASRLARQVPTLNNCLSIRSPIFKRNILDLTLLLHSTRHCAIDSHGMNLNELYLQSASYLHTELMWSALEDAVLLPAALGFEVPDFQALRWLPSSEVWSNYKGLGSGKKYSWIVRQLAFQRIEFPITREASCNLSALVREYQLEEVKSSPLYPMVQAVSRSIVRSKVHFSGGRADEAFLFLIIAIEQVFSARERTTQVISTRTALVVHLDLDMDFSRASKHVEALYDKRSSLVHAGVSISSSDLSQASHIGESVLRCLLRVACAPKPVGHEAWLKRLDYFVAAKLAEKDLDKAELLDNGIV